MKTTLSPLLGISFLATLFSGVITGFFFAWICSTMWGLDAIDPRVAIEAMQGMNASVRNAVFAPAFFGTPLVLLLAGLIARKENAQKASRYFFAGAGVYFCGGFLLTMMINVPMNEALGMVTVPTDVEMARRIWEEYSTTWQIWNVTRTLGSGLAFVLAFLGTWYAAQGK